MTDRYLKPDLVFDGLHLLRDQVVCFSAGRVDHLCAVDTCPKDADIRYVSGIVSPGFTDLQVNGGGDVLLNTAPTTDGLAAIARAHHKLGTVQILPTVITDEIGVIEKAADAAIELGPNAQIAGLHIEGPHIALTRRGTHAAELVRPMDDRTMEALKKLRDANINTMITVAPEAVTLEQVRQMDALGVTVSLGHTDATAEQTWAAFDAGARCVTHLFNAMSQIQNRAPGVVGAAINSDAYTGIICDGHHVADCLVGMAIRARPVPDRVFLVSDAMPTVGGAPSFSLYGQDIALKDGRLVNQEGSLAGAHVTMFQSIQRLVAKTGTDIETALRMGTSIPRAVLTRQKTPEPCLVGREVRDVILIAHDLTGFQQI